MKTLNGFMKVNLTQVKTAYLVTGIVFLAGIAGFIVNLILNNAYPGLDGDSTVAVGNYLFLLPLLMGILVPARNFTKLINLGGKRMDFWKSCLPLYAIVALVVALVSLLLYLVFNPFMLHWVGTIDLFDVFGFTKHGIVLAFIQMSAFLFLIACFAHMLTLIQGRWYGWLVDVLLIAIISVFPPIAPLRSALVWFFNMIIFHDFAIIQIVSCLVLSAAVYALSLIPVRGKNV